MTSVSSGPVARLSTPGEIVATIPALCGFLPHDSLVALSLRGRRRRLGLTVRLDLPPPGAVPDAAELLAERVAQDGAAAAVIVVFADARCPELVSAVMTQCRLRDVVVAEALHVTGDRWTSYLCVAPCCPAEGTAVPPVPGLVAAEQALDGRAVLASREELVRALGVPAHPVDVADARARWAALTPAEARRGALEQARAALDDVTRGGSTSPAVAAALAVALHDVQVRDEVATWALGDSGGLLALAEQVARQVGAPWDAPVGTLVAWIAYSRGDGARANVALDRALRSDPQHRLALLLRQALDAAVPPAQVRDLLRQTREALRGS